jgi:hypothetical protein
VDVLAAGDIADCASGGDETTAALLGQLSGTILAIGDTVYGSADLADYEQCYAPSWGVYKNRTRPALGNHEYTTPDAAGYFSYFGALAGTPGQGYYAFDLGNNWRAYAINSNCDEVGGCGVGSAQYTWLQADLSAHPGMNVLAYWHHPRYSSGSHGSDVMMDPLWDLLVSNGAEVVLSGHDHDYERFAPIGTDDTADAAGVREFVVGVGGKSHYPIDDPIANSEAHNGHAFGVLQLELYPDHYSWHFIAEPGKQFSDSGSAPVH